MGAVRTAVVVTVGVVVSTAVARSAAAGAMLVAVYLLGGLTQSMFAHQTSSALYAALCGLLLGLALRESGRHTSDDGPGVSTKV